MILERNQIETFRRDGFLVVEDFVSASACDQLRKRAAELIEEFVSHETLSIFTTHEQGRLTDDYFLESGDKIRLFFEEEAFRSDGTLKQSKELSINKIGHALHDLDPVFDQFSRAVQIESLVQELGIEDPLLLQSMYIFKQPLIGGEVTCHQDATFLHAEPNEILGLWFALEDATIENGCLWVTPGGHKLGLRSRWVRTNGAGMQFQILGDANFPEEKLIPLEVTKGSVIVLHGLLPHKSLANRSKKSRHAYTLHILPRKCQYLESNWLRRSSFMPLRGFH